MSSSPESDGSNLIVPLNRKIESVSCLSNETSLQSQNSVPQHAIQAFKLLKESAEAQVIEILNFYIAFLPPKDTSKYEYQFIWLMSRSLCNSLHVWLIQLEL